MKKYFSLFLLTLSMMASAQDTAESGDSGNMYFLGIGLGVFIILALLKFFYDNYRDRLEDKEKQAEEEARKQRLQNRQADNKL